MQKTQRKDQFRTESTDEGEEKLVEHREHANILLMSFINNRETF